MCSDAPTPPPGSIHNDACRNSKGTERFYVDVEGGSFRGRLELGRGTNTVPLKGSFAVLILGSSLQLVKQNSAIEYIFSIWYRRIIRKPYFYQHPGSG